MTEISSSTPLVLAGPILRRVDAHKVALWLAVTQPVEARFSISSQDYEKQNFHLDDHFPNFRNIKAGEHLHFLLIDISLTDPLPRDQWIDYSLELKATGTDWIDIASDTPEICYPSRSSLGFILPTRVGSVLHGSCRKPHHASGDGLVEADMLLEKLVENKETDQPAWPSMLVMSGDQIYADDVAGPMLRAIHSIINKLDLPVENFQGLGVPDITNERNLYTHKNCYYHRAEILPKIEENRALLDILFDGVRKPIFTTDTANNHLITLHEHLMMYLMVWSPLPWIMADLSAPSNLNAENKAAYEEEKKILGTFIDGLKSVRRLLSHLPVAMIFDDHDITDDWNLNRQWEEAVYGHPFSRRMIGNGLTSYFLCQAWGNSPDGFDVSFFEQLEGILQNPGNKTHDAFLEQLLRFEGWEYSWQTEPPLIVIDSRTRRWRSESSMVKPSGLLDWEALTELQQKLHGNSSVLLVSPAPIYGVKLIETIQRIFTWFGKPLVVDAENWMAHPGTANAILNIFNHSKTPQNFVILSGDVHYSFMYDVEFRGRNGGPDIWQITSSGLKNEFPRKLLANLDILNRWLYSPRSPLNWFTKRRRMKIIPRKPEGHADGRRVLNAAGIGLVELNETGKPVRVRQLVAGGKPVQFHRMEDHSRWQ